MRILTPVILLTSLLTSSALELAELLRFSSALSTLTSATPGSIPSSGLPAPTQIPSTAILEKLDLRQAPGVAPAAPPPPANPPLPNANLAANPAIPAAPAVLDNPAANPAAAPVVPDAPAPPVAVPPVAGPVTAIAIDPAAPDISLTVQWVETWIGGTFQTWVPRTITLDFKAYMTPSAQPGKGAIGMGTLTGSTGVTKTILIGDAPSARPEWGVGVLAAGVGVLGIL